MEWYLLQVWQLVVVWTVFSIVTIIWSITIRVLESAQVLFFYSPSRIATHIIAFSLPDIFKTALSSS